MSFVPGGYSGLPMTGAEAVQFFDGAAFVARAGVNGAVTAWNHGKDFVAHQKDINLRIYLKVNQDAKSVVENILDGSNRAIMVDFYRYCCKEFSSENMLSALAISDYKKFPTFAKKNFICTELVFPNNINVAAKVKKQIKAEIDLLNSMEMRTRGVRRNAVIRSAPRLNNLAPLPVNIFDNFYNAVIANLCETYVRFEAAFGGLSSAGLRYFNRNVNYKSGIDVKNRIQSNQSILKMQEIGFRVPNELLF